ncbi:MAG TPA: hypothetical protein VN865_08355, partial [Candidatus Acidoferrales bacterium]|nr:hypothetical protein [Candidatus Acidoferrales bacterium]
PALSIRGGREKANGVPSFSTRIVQKIVNLSAMKRIRLSVPCNFFLVPGKSFRPRPDRKEYLLKSRLYMLALVLLASVALSSLLGRETA